MKVYCDIGSAPDKMALRMHDGTRFIALPEEYTMDGADMSMTAYGDRIIIAHPAHPPYAYKDGKWEKITCQT